MISLPAAASESMLRVDESPRRHDLDALRAAAMLLGVAYHSALSFSLGSGWVVQDVRQSKALYVFQAFVHGFRMQLFMLLSGFFTAMLWRRHGVKSMILNRLRRLLLPFIAGLFTVVPAIHWAGEVAGRCNRPARLTTQASPSGGLDGAGPVSGGNVAPSNGGPNEVDGGGRFVREATPETAEALPMQGVVSGETSSEALGWILPSGRRGPRDFWLIGPPSSHEKVLVTLEQGHAEGAHHAELGSGGRAVNACTGWLGGRWFVLLWFLWFLVWLTCLFSVYAVAAEHFRWRVRWSNFIVSQWSLIWLVPLTVVPFLYMRGGGSDFGPETSMGIVPAPRVLCYYAIFFGFGVLYHECDDSAGRLGRSWRQTLPLTLLVVFPLALDVASGVFGFRDGLTLGGQSRLTVAFLQTLYAWMMCFASMGFFRTFIKREHRWIRYAADSSLWCYLAHLPLVILLQGLICQWALPALLKCSIIFCSVSLVLFVSYEKWVRDRWIGTFLNGRTNRYGSPFNR
jgi:hypothetical protein